MNWNRKEQKQQKHQFKSYYCVDCKQRKVCGLLTDWDSEWKNYCCWCYYQSKQERAAEYNSYEETLASKQIDRERKFRQLQLIRSYRGCPKCGSKEVDAYFLYEENRLVCQPCLAEKEGGSSSPISFLEEQKWYKRRWKIDLVEWLENYGCLPVNAECAREWLKDKEHLGKCDCLEVAARKLYELFANSLKESREQLKDCQCEISPKWRVKYIDSAGSGWSECEKCESRIGSAGHHGVIRNRNDPKFWGLEVEERALCRDCLGKLVEEMPVGKKYTFRKYVRRGWVKK